MKKEVVRLADYIEYQQDSVVSKTIIKEEKGNVTLFAFSKDQGLSEHSAPFDAMVNIIDGEAVIIISGTEYPMKTGDSIIMPANEPHAVKSVTDFKMMLIMIKK